MKKWQADFYKIPVSNQQSAIRWELLICDTDGEIVYEADCTQSQANADWLVAQLGKAAQTTLPEIIQVFRPQALGLLTTAAERLGIKVEATRRTTALKQKLEARAKKYPNYNPIALLKPPPQPLPEQLWGEEWNFASVVAKELAETFGDRPIPILDLPQSLLPLSLGIASTTPVPGIVIYGGRNSLQLAFWLQEQKPFALNYIATEVGKSGGLILEAGLVDRWVVATFENEQVAQVAQNYEQRKQQAQGLHFLLVQPDDSGMTYTGFWLLKEE